MNEERPNHGLRLKQKRLAEHKEASEAAETVGDVRRDMDEIIPGEMVSTVEMLGPSGQDALAKYIKARTKTEEQLGRKAKAEADRERSRADRDVVSAEKETFANREALGKELADPKYRGIYTFTGKITDGSVNACLQYLNYWDQQDKKQPWELHIYSPGGEIFAGMRMLDYMTRFKKRGHHITTVAMGIAMSMASIFTQAGDWRVMGNESILMIHKGSLAIGGDFDEVKNIIKFIEEKQQERIIRVFVERAAKSKAKEPVTAEMIRSNWENRDWYLDSGDCLKFGIIDEVL